MKDRRYIIKLLSLTLTFALVFTSLGISVFATDEDGAAAAADQTAVEISDDEAVAEDAAEEVEVSEPVTQEAVNADTTAAISAPRSVKAKAIKQKLANGEKKRKKYLNTDNKIKLTWKAPATGTVHHYAIKCSNGDWMATNIPASKTSYTFEAPVGNRNYKVYAYDKDGNYAYYKIKNVKGWAINKIHTTWNWTAKMDRKTTLYKNKTGSAKIKTLKKGTKGIILRSHPKRPKKWNKPIRVKIQLLDSKGNLTDTVGWVKYGPISASPNIEVKHDYTRAQKEAFANKYTSSTNYLIWVNGYTQRENIFKKVKGKWKLISSNRCTLGNFYQPVSTGTKTLRAKKGTVTMIDDKGRPYYFKYSRTFKGSGYFHTRSYWSSNGKAKNKVQYRPATKGCIRQYTDDAKFVYSLPRGTKILFK